MLTRYFTWFPNVFLAFHTYILLYREKNMALLNILKYPDERLHTVAKPVGEIDDRIRTLVADMT